MPTTCARSSPIPCRKRTRRRGCSEKVDSNGWATSSIPKTVRCGDGSSGLRRNRVNVADAKEDLVVGDLRRSVVIDRRREAFRRVILHANELRGSIDCVLNEREQTVDRLTQTSVYSLAGHEVEHRGHRLALHDHEQRVNIPAEAAPLDDERVRVQILRPPPLTRRGEVGDLAARLGAGGVAARNGGNERCEGGESKCVHDSLTGGSRRPSPRGALPRRAC